MKLTVILDENIPPQIAVYLHSARPSWTVLHVRDVGLKGSADSMIFQWAQKRNAIVVTARACLKSGQTTNFARPLE